MTNELQVFENPRFGAIRTLEEGGKVLFCGKDVCAALGYSNTRDALSRHCKGVVKRDTPTQSGIQEMNFIFAPVTQAKLSLVSRRFPFPPLARGITRPGRSGTCSVSHPRE